LLNKKNSKSKTEEEINTAAGCQILTSPGIPQSITRTGGALGINPTKIVQFAFNHYQRFSAFVNLRKGASTPEPRESGLDSLGISLRVAQD
jgi:hypothetical protein